MDRLILLMLGFGIVLLIHDVISHAFMVFVSMGRVSPWIISSILWFFKLVATGAIIVVIFASATVNGSGAKILNIPLFVTCLLIGFIVGSSIYLNLFGFTQLGQLGASTFIAGVFSFFGVFGFKRASCIR